MIRTSVTTTSRPEGTTRDGHHRPMADDPGRDYAVAFLRAVGCRRRDLRCEGAEAAIIIFFESCPRDLPWRLILGRHGHDRFKSAPKIGYSIFRIILHIWFSQVAYKGKLRLVNERQT